MSSRQTDKVPDGRLDRLSSGRTDEVPDGRTDRWTDGRTDKVAEAGVPLTSLPLEYGIPMYEVNAPVTPLEGEQVEGGQGNPSQSVGVAVVVGVDGIFGKDIKVFYPLNVLWSITLHRTMYQRLP
jgi:hypothetical protein